MSEAGAGPPAVGQVDFELLAARYALPDPAATRLAGLAALLASDPLAPTTVRHPRRVLEDHLADSLVALELPQLAAAGELVDLGAGAGLPGLALAIARPALAVTLVEGNARKCEFIARAASSCGLTNTRVVAARAEAWPAGIGRFDLVTARALAALEVVAEYAAPLLRPAGVLVVWRGRRDPDSEARAARAARILGLEAADPIAVRPYVAAAHRHLHVFAKTGPTPERFPRRPGVARKRPLGAAGGKSTLEPGLAVSADPPAASASPDRNASDRRRR